MWALTRENLSLEFANNKVADQKVSHLDFTVQGSAPFVNTFYIFFLCFVFVFVILSCFPGVVSLIPARSNTFVEIDHEIIYTVILLPSAESFKKGFCQLQVKVCAQSTG